jgi:hypothetical protein
VACRGSSCDPAALRRPGEIGRRRSAVNSGRDAVARPSIEASSKSEVVYANGSVNGHDRIGHALRTSDDRVPATIARRTMERRAKRFREVD